MHMADALLSPAVGGAFWAATAGATAYCSRKLKNETNDRLLPLMGVMGAFVFASQMINFTIPATGSSGHLGGGLLLAILLGPYAGFLVMASVLSVQSLFFADGGILALGANVWNIGFYQCFIAYPFIYKPIAGSNPSPARITAAAILAAVVGLQFGALSVVLQTLFSGRSELPFASFLLMMQPIHLAIGIVEGIVTAGVLNFVRREKPEIIASVQGMASSDIPYRRVLGAFLIMAILAGGIGAWFASQNPDGLEWSIEKVTGGLPLPERQGKAFELAETIQEKTAILPDYGLKGVDEAEPSRLGTTISGLAGSLLVLVLVYALGMALRRHRKSATDDTHGR